MDEKREKQYILVVNEQKLFLKQPHGLNFDGKDILMKTSCSYDYDMMKHAIQILHGKKTVLDNYKEVIDIIEFFKEMGFDINIGHFKILFKFLKEDLVKFEAHINGGNFVTKVIKWYKWFQASKKYNAYNECSSTLKFNKLIQYVHNGKWDKLFEKMYANPHIANLKEYASCSNKTWP